MNKKYVQLAESMVIIQNEQEKDPFLNKLYMVLHLANWDCENIHEEWKKEVEELFSIYNNI